MKLEDLYPNFLLISEALQTLTFHSYAGRRQQDLINPVRFVKKTSRKPTAEAIQLTEEEKKLMKSLGLKQSDLLKLRASITVPDEEPEEDDEEEVEP